jgi:hypothetical protein
LSKAKQVAVISNDVTHPEAPAASAAVVATTARPQKQYNIIKIIIKK